LTKARKFFSKARKFSEKFDTFHLNHFKLEPERVMNAFLHVMLATIHELLVVDPDVRKRDRVMFIDLLASILF